MVASVTILKIILALVMVALTLLFGLLPMPVLKYLRKRAANARSREEISLDETGNGSRWPGLVLCLLSCFTGGVFFGTCFLHLLPEVNEHLATIKSKYDWESDYPIAELVSCLGFFLIFFLEEIVVTFLHGGHGHSHGSNKGSETPVLVHVHGSDSSNLPSSPAKVEEAETTETTALNASDVRLRVNGKGLPYPMTPNNNSHKNSSILDHTNSNSKFSARAPSPPFSEVFTSLEVAEPERCEGPCEGQDEHPPILMNSRPHPHSHGVRSITLVLALSIHSIVEGLSLGIANSESAATTLFLSLIVHKVIVAFSVGLQLARTHAHQLRLVFISIILLSIMTPLGIATGIAVQEGAADSMGKELALLVFEGAAVGTFLYVTFFEVLIHERDNTHPNLLKLLLIMVGFGLIGALRAIEHEHGDHKSHNDSQPNFVAHHNHSH